MSFDPKDKSGKGRSAAETSIEVTATRDKQVIDDEKNIHDRIVNAITEQRLTPGTKLREEQLCQIFGVSRTRIRKVLQHLKYEQLIEIHANRGALVAQPTVEKARDIFAARRLIESGLIATVASSVTDPQLDELRAAVEREKANEGVGNRHIAIRLSGHFHLLIAEYAGNETLHRILQELINCTQLIIALYERPGTPLCSSDSHARLVELIATADETEAADMMKRHLEEVEARIDLSPSSEKAVDLRSILLAPGSHG